MAILEANFIQERFNQSIKDKAIVQFFMVTGYKFYGKVLGSDTYNYLVQVTNAEGVPKELKTSLVFKSAISTIETNFIPNIDLTPPKPHQPKPKNNPKPPVNNNNVQHQNRPQNNQNPKQSSNSNQNVNSNHNQSSSQNNKNNSPNGGTLQRQIQRLNNRVTSLEGKVFPNLSRRATQNNTQGNSSNLKEKVSSEEVKNGIERVDQNLTEKKKPDKKENKPNEAENVEKKDDKDIEDVLDACEGITPSSESASVEDVPKEAGSDEATKGDTVTEGESEAPQIKPEVKALFGELGLP